MQAALNVKFICVKFSFAYNTKVKIKLKSPRSKFLISLQQKPIFFDLKIKLF